MLKQPCVGIRMPFYSSFISYDYFNDDSMILIQIFQMTKFEIEVTLILTLLLLGSIEQFVIIIRFKIDIFMILTLLLLRQMVMLQPPFCGQRMNLNCLRQRIERCEYPPIASDVYSVEVIKRSRLQLNWH